MFEDELIEDWYVDATSCMWLKINDGSMIISEWFSGFVCDSVFSSVWQWFGFKVQCFEICTRVCFMERVYIHGYG